MIDRSGQLTFKLLFKSNLTKKYFKKALPNCKWQAFHKITLFIKAENEQQ